MENYNKHLKEERQKKLSESSTLIENFTEYCFNKNIKLSADNFDYIPTIGIVATYPNIVGKLSNAMIADKEELFEVSEIEKNFTKRSLASGYYYSDKYMLMAHPYFRRGHYEINNFSPRFIDIFWEFNKPNIEKYISIDTDRVRINVDGTLYKEFDTWYGAKFNNNISDIEDGIVKLRSPLDLDSFDIDFFFGGTYSLDIKWTSKDSIKTFQAEEFKSKDNKITKNGIEYYPVKYLHAEFDSTTKSFRHFDGAIHFYNEEEYFIRRDSDFNHNNKNNLQLKTLSQKLFKINGQLNVEDWAELTSQYLTGNPLINEYFEGKFPDRITEIIEAIRANKNTNGDK